MTSLRFHDGQAHLTASNEEPFPIKVMADPQSRNIVVNQAQPPQVAVSVSLVTLIAPANPRRRAVMLTNLTGTQVCHLSTESDVSATTSRAILTAVPGSSVTLYTKDAIYGLSITAAQTILVWDEETAE